ncbi:hypothetical protein ABIA35_005308 [Catenulispora sp. MAP12-49]|uniref:STM4015 family protein n=1 Tax=unclassified Catenulispora TaxID=414885 RepID=UPI0035198ECD
MSFVEYLETFGGLPVVAFSPHPEAAIPEVTGDVALRIDCYYDDDHGSWADDWFEFEDIWERFLATVDTTRVTALTIGMWSEYMGNGDYPVAELLAKSADRLPALRALFLGDIFEGGDGGSDTAYIEHGDLAPILRAYPRLEELWVRGCPEQESLYFEPLRHSALRKLVFESGGLPPTVMRTVGECDLPALRHLEFYFGDPNYGGDATPADVEWLLSGQHFQNLKHLGLRDSVIQDEIAAAVAHAPIVSRLTTLDLSLGTLGDEGAAALLAGQPLTHLAKLDLNHHYISAAMQDRLRAAWPGVDVDLSDAQNESRGRRYIAVAE